jgi:hypothetical protein
MSSMFEYFDNLAFDCDEQGLIVLLRDAISNSKRKGYHGLVEKEYSNQQY